MHQQVSIFGSVRDSEIKSTLHTLTAFTGMRPVKIFDRNVCWAPRQYEGSNDRGSSRVEQYRILSIDSLKDDDKGVEGFHECKDALRINKNWSLKISEIPEGGEINKTFTSQTRLTAKVVDGDLISFMDNLGYEFEYEYWMKGHYFVHENTVIQLFRLYRLEAPIEPEKMVLDGDELKPENGGNDTPEKSLQLLDPSGNWVIKAFINVKSLTDMDAFTTARNQLDSFQAEISELVKFSTPERNSFDTRMRRR